MQALKFYSFYNKKYLLPFKTNLINRTINNPYLKAAIITPKYNFC